MHILTTNQKASRLLWWSKHPLNQGNVAEHTSATGRNLCCWYLKVLTSDYHLLLWQIHHHWFHFCCNIQQSSPLSNPIQKPPTWTLSHSDNLQIKDDSLAQSMLDTWIPKCRTSPHSYNPAKHLTEPKLTRLNIYSIKKNLNQTNSTNT